MVLILVSKLFIPCFGYADQMDFYGFIDGACRHTLKIALVAWVLFSLSHDLISLGGICIGPSTNNIAEYQVVIGLLTEAASRYIHNLVVFMDSQLVDCHLNHVYTINTLYSSIYFRECVY